MSGIFSLQIHWLFEETLHSYLKYPHALKRVAHCMAEEDRISLLILVAGRRLIDHDSTTSLA